MKILILSDSHGRNTNMERVINKVSPFDMCIHLGDLEGCENYLEAVLDCPIEMIPGNNDYFMEIEREKEIFIGNHKILLTHGHRHRVNFGIQDIARWGKENQAQIVMFGHTHVPLIKEVSGVMLINPGSISRPRQEGHKPSYIIMELDRKGEVHFTINYLK